MVEKTICVLLTCMYDCMIVCMCLNISDRCVYTEEVGHS